MTRTRPIPAVALLLAGLGPAVPVSLAARTATAKAASEARPDRALYEEAQRALASLNASAARLSRRVEWEKVVARFRRVVARYPQSAYCDDALMQVGHLLRAMAKKFGSPRLNDDAVEAYRSLVAEYPSSRHGDDALFAVFEIAKEGGDAKEIAAAGRAYVQAFPTGGRAGEIKAHLHKATREALPQPPPPGLARVFNLRFWTGDASTRVVIDVEKKVPLRYDRIQNPDRLFIDLVGTRLHPNLSDRQFPVGDGLLEQIRIAQNKENVVRVVLDFKEVKDHSILYLENPTRLVVDVQGTRRVTQASIEPFDGDGPPFSRPAPRPTPSPEAARDKIPEAERDGQPGGPLSREPTKVVEGPRPPAVLQTLPSPTVRTLPSPTVREIPPIPIARTAPSAPLPAETTRAGSYSLARQLGLGVRRIVIDAGHGGHDPGSIGPTGFQEKELVLDVALRLQKLVRAELGADTVMTRSTDVFIPLEERTAVANAREGDLFLSIHANSSRGGRSRGIETYFLNFAADRHAEAVAARENAISSATLKDLQGLVKKITLNSKIDESREFAQTVQEAMVGRLKPEHPEIEDRGVRTAPFYVLIGANMPSILAEISFISHPQEERLLRSPDHRQRIAESLLDGVKSYLQALDRTQPRLMTRTLLTGEARKPTVDRTERRRR